MRRLLDIPLEIAERLDYPAESVTGVPKLTVTGRRRALVENHCGLLAYSRECIIIDGGRTRVCLRGTDLQLVAMDSAAVLISGTIVCAASEPVDAYTLRFTVRERCAETVSALARRCQCTVKTVSRRGLPRLLRRAARYRGLCAALLLLMLAVSVSSLFVWRIDVTGNEALTTGQILRCLDACGVRPGTYWPGLSNDLVRNDMILRLPQLRWLTVNVRGSCAEVIVREKDPLPDITPDDTPVSIYAAATGVILHMDVYAGEARVAPGAAVEPGDVLVSGAVGDLGGGVRPVCARAEIRARTRQELTGQIALTESEKQPAHGARTRWALRVGEKRINFYQNSGISERECDKIICEYPFAIRGVFALPFSLVRERVQPYRTASVPVSADAARAALEQALLQRLRQEIGADGTILAYETAAQTAGGVLTVTLTAECEQEIGRAQATPDAEFLQLRPPAGEGTTADD